MLALANLLLFSWFEIAQDKADGHSSFALHFGDRVTRITIAILFVVLTVLLVPILYSGNVAGFVTCAAMTAGLLVIFIFPQHFRKASRYRLMGDSIFLLPLLTLVYES